MSQNPDFAPVIIVGGGPSGLTSSILLSNHSVPHLLFERSPSTSIHPKSCGINQRTIEIFRRLGLESILYDTGAPQNTSTRTAWYTALGPNGREICARNSWGGGEYADPYEEASPCYYTTLPQIRLEPILRKRATELNPNGLFYNHEVIDVVEDEQHVTITVHDRSNSSAPRKLTCTYLLGCDGGRFLADSLPGLEWVGPSNIVDMISAHIRTPISLYHPDPRIFISWFINPKMGGSIKTGVLYHLGPYPIDPKTEEWIFVCALPPGQRQHFTEETMRQQMHDVLQIDQLDCLDTGDKSKKPVDILSMSHWSVNAKVVSRYYGQHKRVFLVGDAAHKVPPWGAFGMNTGIQDADNICWKLAWALKNGGGIGRWDGLLTSYDEERRSIGERVAKTSLHNMVSHAGELDKAIGILPDKSVEENLRAMEEYFDEESEKGKEKREAVKHALKILDKEFYAHGMEVGWFYESADVNGEGTKTNHNGQIDEYGEFDGIVYHASTIPGHHLPHAWLTDKEGERWSTRDLVRFEQFVIIAGDVRWRQVKSKDVHVEIVGADGEWKDVDGMWEKLRGVGETGAVLVRPDGIVGWRWKDDAILNGQDAEKSIESVVNRILRVR